MNRTIDWKSGAELVGIVAIVASIIFLALQIKQSQIIAENERGYSSIETRLALNSAIMDHAAVWIAGNAGQELQGIDATVYAQLIENLNWFYFSAWQSAGELDLIRYREIVTTDFAGLLHDNPGALQAWRKYLSDREKTRRSFIAGYDKHPYVEAIEAKLAKMSEQ